MTIKMNVLVSALAAISMTTSGCLKRKGGDNNNPGNNQITADVTQKQAVEIPIKFSFANGGLSLANSNKYSISLEGCASGLTSTVTNLKGTVTVYLGDKNCLAKLNSFEYSDVAYTPLSGSGFSTWRAGDKATFVGTNGSNLMVSVLEQLPEIIVSNGAVSYEFTEINQATGAVIDKGNITTSQAVSIGGESAPAFTIGNVTMGTLDQNGSALFTINLECNQPMTGTGLTSVCKDRALSNTTYVLIKDTYSSSLTYEQAQALFQGGAGTAIASGKVSNVGNSTMPKGGFTAEARGPAQMHNNPNMILVVQGTGAQPAYSYYNIDVSGIAPTDNQ